MSFTANGEPGGFLGEFAQPVDLLVEAQDTNGDVVRATFFLDGEAIDSVEGPATSFATEWIISGAAMNGIRSVTVVVEDNDGNTASRELVATLSMPNGGFVEEWEDEGGFSYAIGSNADGTVVVAGGIEQPSIDDGDEPIAQTLRLDGRPWGTGVHEPLLYVSDIVVDESETVWALASIPAGSGSDSALLQMNLAGDIIETFTFDAGVSPNPQDGADFPLSLSMTPTGDLIVNGTYAPLDGSPAIGSFVMRVTQAGELVWLERISETAGFEGEPFGYEVAVGANESVLISGSRPVDGALQAWFGWLDADGAVIGETTIDDYFESTAYAAAATPDGRFAIAGTQRPSTNASWNRWVRVFNADGDEEWARESTDDGSFSQAVVFDDFGNVAVASNESCEFDLADFAFGRCTLRIRKYDAAGEFIWAAGALSAAPEFNGPVLGTPGIQADLSVDRFGYVYASGLHRVPSPVRGDWWTAKLNP